MSQQRKDIPWSEVRQLIKDKIINEQQFRNWLMQKDAGVSPKEILELIVNHVYHSMEEHLYAPVHLRF